MGATLAVIGLGRIGAFHAETLSGLAGVDELVVTDERPRLRPTWPTGSVPARYPTRRRRWPQGSTAW
jgi:hypothetical protein